MSKADSTAVKAVEHTLPWGPTVRGQRWGAGSDRVVLLHEPGADIDHWGELPRMLSRLLPARVLAYDLPGHGLSDDPWEPARLPDLIRALAAPAGDEHRTCLAAAGATARAAIDLAEELHLAALVGLSPVEPATPAHAVTRSPGVPKLLIAGSLAGGDLDDARHLASVLGGWGVVTSVPVDARGTGILATDWSGRVTEAIYGFLRDCLGPRRLHPGKMLLRGESSPRGPSPSAESSLTPGPSPSALGEGNAAVGQD